MTPSPVTVEALVAAGVEEEAAARWIRESVKFGTDSTDTLPQTIPAGEYVVHEDRYGDQLIIRVFNDGTGDDVVKTTGGAVVFIPPAAVRHLLDLPDRPYSEALDGPRSEGEGEVTGGCSSCGQLLANRGHCVNTLCLTWTAPTPAPTPPPDAPAPYVPPVGAVLTTAWEALKLPEGWEFSATCAERRGEFQRGRRTVQGFVSYTAVLAWPPVTPKTRQVPWQEAVQSMDNPDGLKHPGNDEYAAGGIYEWYRGPVADEPRGWCWVKDAPMRGLPGRTTGRGSFRVRPAPDGTVPVLDEGEA